MTKSSSPSVDDAGALPDRTRCRGLRTYRESDRHRPHARRPDLQGSGDLPRRGLLSEFRLSGRSSALHW